MNVTFHSDLLDAGYSSQDREEFLMSMKLLAVAALISSISSGANAAKKWVDPTPPAEKALIASGPCHSAFCSDINEQKLQDAWTSDWTTTEQRAKLASIITQTTVSGITNWQQAVDIYFKWRASTLNYAYDPDAKGLVSAPPPQRDFRRMRVAAESAIRSRLIDPTSAQFEWPYGFARAGWKPFLTKHVEGWILCGTVNARNRLGGYVGSAAVVGVVGDDYQVVFIDMDKPEDSLSLVAVQCKQHEYQFPQPQTGMFDTPPLTSGDTVVEQLTKLAALKDRGLLTQAEFDAQKAKLLAH